MAGPNIKIDSDPQSVAAIPGKQPMVCRKPAYSPEIRGIESQATLAANPGSQTVILTPESLKWPEID